MHRPKRTGGTSTPKYRRRAVSISNVGTDANTNEKVLKSFTIPAGFFGKNGKSITGTAWGTYAGNANTKTIRIRLGPVTLTGTILYTLGGNFSGGRWRIDFEIFRTGVDAQAFTGLLTATAGAGQVNPQEAVAANDDATAMLAEVTGQNAVAAANDIVCTGAQFDSVESP